MDEDQETERFGMDNDYDDRQRIDGEFYYRRQREKLAQTKDDVLYGVFASGDSNSDYDDSSKRKRRKDRDLLGKADLSKPVNFVSTGRSCRTERLTRTQRQRMRMKNPLSWMRIGRAWGLEKNQQGIVTFIEAKLRPRDMGVGFNDLRGNSCKGTCCLVGARGKEAIT